MLACVCVCVCVCVLGQTFWVSKCRTYWGFPTRMVYFYYISCLRYTILAGNPRYKRWVGRRGKGLEWGYTQFFLQRCAVCVCCVCQMPAVLTVLLFLSGAVSREIHRQRLHIAILQTDAEQEAHHQGLGEYWLRVLPVSAVGQVSALVPFLFSLEWSVKAQIWQ